MAELEGVALISSMTNQSDEWSIDSAATKHCHCHTEDMVEDIMTKGPPKPAFQKLQQQQQILLKIGK